MGAADVTAGRTEKYREDCEKQVLCDDSILWNERNLWQLRDMTYLLRLF